MLFTTLKRPLLGVLFSSLLLFPLLSHAYPMDPELSCEAAGGVWDDSLDTLCAPCNLCLSTSGELREDTANEACPPVCNAWCQCPEGTVFYNYSQCIPVEEYPVSCQDENPQVMTCTDSGGTWTSCVDTCTYCLSDSGATMMTEEGCPEVCEYGCNCPEGQSFTEEGCKPDAEVLPSCSDAGGDPGGDDGGDDGEGNGEIEESDSCDQLGSRAPLWVLLLSLIAVITRRGVKSEPA